MWKRCRDNEVLRVKGEKVSFGKYQQTVFNSRRTLHQFALKGFYFGIAARKLDLKALQSSALPSKPLRKAAIANQTELPTGGPTLKQEKVDLDKLSINPVNQLDRAAVTFNTIENYHKSFIATSVLTHTADYHTKQAKTLRSTEKGIKWESDQCKGDCHTHVRLTVKQISYTRNYPNCGIETSWKKQLVDERDPRIAYSCSRSRQLWDCCFASVREWEQRNMSFQAGHRRQVLILDDDDKVADAYLAEFKGDGDKDDELMQLDDEWAELYQKKVFVETSLGHPAEVVS